MHREDDRVTRWVKANIRDCYQDEYIWHRLVVARMLNWPPTLEVLYRRFGGAVYPWDWAGVLHFLQRRKADGHKVFGSAYIVSTNGQKVAKDEYVVKLWEEALKHHSPVADTCEETHLRLMGVRGLASFMAAQIVADLKHVPGPHGLGGAVDKYDWCAPGPGSIRGLNRVLGLKPQQRTWRNPEFHRVLLDLGLQVDLHPLTEFVPEIHAQDLQNCLCEFDKYQRIKEGGRVRAGYRPHTYTAPPLEAMHGP